MVQLHDPNLVVNDVTGDPDPLLSCNLMEGRDTFLTLAWEKHWEFSSLRRAKYSSLAMLVTLHTQGRERFLYTCNMCQQPVETRYHCSECEVRLSRGRWHMYICTVRKATGDCSHMEGVEGTGVFRCMCVCMNVRQVYISAWETAATADKCLNCNRDRQRDVLFVFSPISPVNLKVRYHQP